MSEANSPQAAADPRPYLLAGMRAALSIPGLILASAFVGFGGLARDAGFSLLESLFMTVTIWALPAMVVLVGATQSGATLAAAAFAVALSSVRLMPMVMALVPEMRGPATRRWVLYALSHFVAVTSWVIAFQNLPAIPREHRTTWYAGLGMTLVAINATVVTVVYLLAPALPDEVAAGLLFLTPMYFLTSMAGSMRESAGYVAMAAGLVLGPLFHIVLPGFDLLAAGLIGGALASAFHFLPRRAA
jgi:predicted branched-subunit amino acid permease